MRIAVVIVNYNAGALLERCIQHLERQSRKADRVLVADNASSDESLAPLEQKTSTVEILRLDRNYGFAKANNIAIDALADCDWVALLNPDAFADVDWIRNIEAAIRANPDYRFFATCMLDAADPEIIDGAGDGYHVNGKAWPLSKGGKRRDIGEGYKEVFSPCAGAGVYAIAAVRDAGGFDEEFFCYYEDVDLGFRLRLQGDRCLFIPNAVVHHVGSAITGKASDFSIYHAHRNFFYCYMKNMPAPLFQLFLPYHLYINLMSTLYFVVKGRGAVILKSKRDALRALPGLLEKRKAIQRARRIGYRDLLSRLSMGPIARRLLGPGSLT